MAGLGVLFLFDPAATPIYPLCPFHFATGLWCPGCGATRALHALLHGELERALELNALLVACLTLTPAAVLLARSSPRFAELLRRPATIWLGAAVALAFGILRNLPAWRWLAPV
jgi:pyruvate/2-oxoacid:ferredoxin oxidoreductase beta subunit